MPTEPVIRPESPADVGAIARITEAAFREHPHSQQTEQYIVEALRASGALTLSLVAEADGAVIGHIAFSPVAISDGSPEWYALGPVSVAPRFQGRGTGQALVRAGLRALEQRGARGCVLVGDPAFYGRFGFRSNPRCTMEGVPQEYVLSLAFGDQPQAFGEITHHEAFGSRGPRR